MFITIKSVKGEKFPLEHLDNYIEKVNEDTAKALDKIGIKTRDYMRTWINTHRKRNPETHNDKPDENRLTERDNLSNTIKSESFFSPGLGFYTVGIGNIDFITTHAPYAFLINDGGSIDVNSSFIPGSFEGQGPDSSLKGRGTQSFSYSNGGGMGFANNNLSIISPMKYMEATNIWLKANLSNLLRAENIGK